ncbi:MAG: crossover junction endodeoxyribonuclease RuvC [Deltaproteobacteria bacterium]|nr:crossover junction endodeoxyribonuclease RuvC [Deltaproteobacteria bacterium]MBW1941807.1 crossover junction endodeoxyribonuclease RuvC [Deltaproteobacteria bacterium]MBW2208605.1 crossover junction endodeoxyribonuclease RuvC [Deltaproteobacteria bacterium]
MLLLGVDPGSRVTGYGLVEKKQSRMTCIHAGTIAPPGNLPLYQRIHKIFESMVDLISRYQPAEMAMEDIFFAKNVKSALKIGHARGAIMVAAAQCGLEVFEYSPLEIKKAVVGYGRATKEQVRSMVQAILNMGAIPSLDASDALATAICHLNWTRFDKKS